LIILKVLAALAAAIAFVIISGITGVTFYVWPTGLADHQLAVSPQMLEKLENLQAERKFDQDIRNLYPGARNESSRVEAQALVDKVIATLRTELPSRPQRSTVLREFKNTLAWVDSGDSEDRDQILMYLTRIMDIVGVENSGELMNVWRYGFPYGWVL
jgi:hypothetical protein